MIFRTLLAATAVLALSSPLVAQTDEAKPAAKAETAYEANSASKALSGTFGGRSIRYTATVEEQVLKGEDGTPKAAIVTTSYVAEPRDPSRPVTFLFNGGPGSGSVWLQMGAFGPKRVAIPSDARDDGAPPYPILDNPDSLLDVTDLVFIDPVGTGFSHTIGDTKGEEYWGVTKDAKSVAEVIRIWLSENGRWNSPKFLGGESYGTTRSAAVVHELEGGYNDVSLNGVILISTVLDFGAGAETEGAELGYITTLPSMAATALYHGKATAPSVEQFVEEARQFAIGPYAAFLLKGQNASTQERAAVRAELARFTGLSEEFLDRADLRVSSGRFYKELLRDRGLTVGRLDSRYTGTDYDSAGEYPDNDPSFYGIDGGYTAAINHFMRDTLGYETERNYVTIGSVQPWDWRLEGGRDTNAYLNVAPYLGKALRENSGMRIFVGQGWYDFATPFFAAEYALTRTGFPQDRIEWRYYDAGHMMYVRDEDRHKLSEDVRAFIRAR
ncbi:S10 family peptidase [Pelagerythrobacter rhizovicinus]|uniref:Peptidase S10 n=1 Tax=Pelagerythrobacter rhizovicinus TaxID=2268576 RepID=A0A4Q2KK34_9SPHN|nr:peptidase S10 [Pelagerythrobacter rhizovicinus]RXZ65614.1 peptidase S10 [Pelagerythrobacter rhizovicinus]